MLMNNTELRLAFEEIRRKTENNTKNIEVVFQYLDELLERKEKPKPRPEETIVRQVNFLKALLR